MVIFLDEHQLLVFWAELLVLVVVARSLGSLMRRLGLPSVIGELGAGLLLGPSVLGKLWPSGFDWLFPADEVQSAMLLAVGWVGIALVLLVTGFETDLTLIRQLGKAVAYVTAGSLILPFVAGLVTGSVLPDSFVGEDASRLTFTLFVAAALAVSSLAVVGKILSDLGMMRRNFGQITVAAGMANDAIGWLLLAVFAGFATAGTDSLGRLAVTVGGLALLLVVSFTVGQKVIDALLREVRKEGENVGGALTVTVFVMLGFAVATQALGVEAVLGAFVAGVVLYRSRYMSHGVSDLVEGLTIRFFGPVFFATAGLRVDLGLLSGTEERVAVVGILLAAIGFKFIGSYLGARRAGLSNREGLALGSGLNARGTLEIVIATVALSLGVFSDTAFTAIVLVPIVTSVFASIALRVTARDWRGTVEEQERLDLEESLSRNIVVKDSRLLLPSRGKPGSIAAAQVLHFAWPTETPATVFSVGRGEPDLTPIVNVLDDREHDVFLAASDSASATEIVDRIVSEANYGYGVIGVGAADRPVGGAVISPVIDELLPRSQVPVVIVRPARDLETRLPGAFTRALVPVVGGRSSRAAQEIAFNISKQLGTELVLSHVVSRREASEVPFLPHTFQRRPMHPDEEEVGRALMAQAVDLAAEIGVRAHTTIRTGVSAGQEIVAAAEEIEADLVLLGARLRRLEGRPFLGYNAERVLDECDATVVAVIVPDEFAD